MDKKDALVRSLVELKAAHEQATKELSDIITKAATLAKGGENLPSLTSLRHYKQAIATAKVHATQAELVLAEYAVPTALLDSLSSHRHYH